MFLPHCVYNYWPHKYTVDEHANPLCDIFRKRDSGACPEVRLFYIGAHISVPATIASLIHDLSTEVYSTAVGYTAGTTKNPTYREVCSGRTGHNEVSI